MYLTDFGIVIDVSAVLIKAALINSTEFGIITDVTDVKP